MNRSEKRTLTLGVGFVFILLIWLFLYMGWGVNELKIAAQGGLFFLIISGVIILSAGTLWLKDKVLKNAITKRSSVKISPNEIAAEVTRISMMYIVSPFLLLYVGVLTYAVWANYANNHQLINFFNGGLFFGFCSGLLISYIVIKHAKTRKLESRLRRNTTNPIAAVPFLLLGMVFVGGFPFRRGLLYYLFSSYLKTHPQFEALFMSTLFGFLLALLVGLFIQAQKRQGMFSSPRSHVKSK